MPDNDDLGPVDTLAKEIFYRRQGADAQWRGRRTNRAYYRRLARAEITRQLKDAPE